jgi:multiple sugar transport system ATP-binding protein
MKVKLVHLSKEFFSLRGKARAVDDITLEIGDEEFFVLLGPSGCGKSTMLNLLAGLEKPSRGEIWFDRRLVASVKDNRFLPPKDRNVAMVFQSYALYPHMSVYENIAFPLRIARSNKDVVDRAVKKAAIALGIDNLLAARPAELSGGQRQRVAIARATVRQPSLFLLDEPLSNLDAQLRLSTRAELKHLQRTLGVTTAYVTHDQTEAMTLGDRIAVLRDGRLEQVGTPDELYSHPANPFVATFIGSPPMNLLPASVCRENDEISLLIGKTRLELPESFIARITRIKSEELTLGIRPEDVTVDPKDSISPTLSGRIEAVEPLGREALLHISYLSTRFTALTDKADFSVGNTVTVKLDLNKAVVFEKG